VALQTELLQQHHDLQSFIHYMWNHAFVNFRSPAVSLVRALT